MKKYLIYGLLTLLSFTVMYLGIFWVSEDAYWYEPMLEDSHGRASLLIIFTLSVCLGGVLGVAYDFKKEEEKWRY